MQDEETQAGSVVLGLSMTTTGSLPTTHASCPGGKSDTSPGPNSSSFPIIHPHSEMARDMKSAVEQVKKLDSKLRELQYLLYAEGKRSLFICLQALDAAGKDGTINRVLGSSPK